MIPDKPISFYHAGFVKFFNQGLKSSFPDSPLVFVSKNRPGDNHQIVVCCKIGQARLFALMQTPDL